MISGIGNGTDFEISTRLSLTDISATQLQEITNALMAHDKRLSIKTATVDIDGQVIISKATKQDINDASSILGSVDGISDEITIRIYDCTDSQLEAIKNNYDVINIRNF